MVAERLPLTYRDYSQVAQDGDIALWRPNGRWGWSSYIARATGGPFSHVTGIVFWTQADRWMSCGYQESKGGYAEPLDVVISKWPGRIDVYRVNQEIMKPAKDCIAKRLTQDLGHQYQWWSIWRMAWPLLPLMGLFTPQDSHERRVAKTSRAAICSEHVHRSFEACGISLVRGESGLIKPNDIYRSAITDYVGTLTG